MGVEALAVGRLRTQGYRFVDSIYRESKVVYTFFDYKDFFP